MRYHEVLEMTLNFEVRLAAKCPKKDVIAAMGIYSASVDSSSRTDTNQIKYYIGDIKSHHTGERDLFFYLFYGNDGSVEGFAEFAFLHSSATLIIDYLCTKERNHMLFYNFYHMVLNEIERDLQKRGLFIEYIVTELSLAQAGGKLIDRDSNYFRQLLSNENFKLLKYPYYQPPLQEDEQAEEFNLAIKRYSIDKDDTFLLKKGQYLRIVKDIYMAHYLEWYRNNWDGNQYKKIVDELLSRIESEFLPATAPETIALVQCKLFEEGQCPKYEAENYTISAGRKRKRKKVIIILVWFMLSVITAVLCTISIFAGWSARLCAFLTIIPGLISISHELFYR